MSAVIRRVAVISVAGGLAAADHEKAYGNLSNEFLADLLVMEYRLLN
jgi:hypothetical protein